MNPKSKYINKIFGDTSTGVIGKINSAITPKTPTNNTVVQNTSATTPKPIVKPNMSYAPQKSVNMSLAPTNIAQKKTPSVNPSPIIKSTTPSLPPIASTFIDNLTQPKPQIPPTTSPVETPQPTQTESPYKKYLDAMLADQKRVADIKNESEAKELQARRGYEQALDTAGGLVSGAQQSASQLSRRANQELADIALRESAASRTAGLSANAYEQFKKESAPIEVGGQLYQKQDDGTYKVIGGKAPEGFTLGKDQVRYDAQGNIIAGGISGGQGTGYTPGANPTADAWVKYVQNGGKISDVPNEYQNAVALGTTSQAKPQSEISKQTVTTIDQLLTNPSFDKIFGPVDQLLGGLVGPQAILAKNQYNQLKGLLSLENIKYLKGTGAISDAEQKLLSNAASQLSRGLYGEQARQVLTKLKQDLSVVKDGQLAPDEEAFLKSQGYTEEEIKSLKGFNSVGNTSASNIPQRNKNPGNVKSGGLADSLAVGKDSQGHLIFPDEATGFKALAMDLEAKINGKSKYLPQNPTISQLGQVYAEDKKWGEKVAKILGVSPLTPTKNIPIDKLTQAIARQEGYFA